MTPFVGVSEKLLTEEQLRTLLQQPITSPSYYFLRWSHKVSGIVKELPDDFPSPEGQMFNRELELRWKKQGQKFSVLLLSTIGEKPGFEPVGQDWQVREQDAHFYSATETRFPKGIPSTSVDVAQRYFMDAKTAMVHFVALTVF